MGWIFLPVVAEVWNCSWSMLNSITVLPSFQYSGGRQSQQMNVCLQKSGSGRSLYYQVQDYSLISNALLNSSCFFDPSLFLDATAIFQANLNTTFIFFNLSLQLFYCWWKITIFIVDSSSQWKCEEHDLNIIPAPKLTSELQPLIPNTNKAVTFAILSFAFPHLLI